MGRKKVDYQCRETFGEGDIQKMALEALIRYLNTSMGFAGVKIRTSPEESAVTIRKPKI